MEEVTWCGRASLLSILSDSHIGCAWSAVSECLVKPNQTLADAAFPPHSPLLTYFQALTPTDGSGGTIPHQDGMQPPGLASRASMPPLCHGSSADNQDERASGYWLLDLLPAHQ